MKKKVLDKINREADTEPIEPELLAGMKRLWADAGIIQAFNR